MPPVPPLAESGTRPAIVAGARRVIAERGLRKTSMGEVAIRSGVAKATVYNHVRDKSELADLVLRDAVDTALRRVSAATDLVGALAILADLAADDDVVVGLRVVEPSVLTALVCANRGTRYDAIRVATARALTPHLPTERALHLPTDRSAVTSTPDTALDLILRWVASHLLNPGTDSQRQSTAELLAAALGAPRADLRVGNEIDRRSAPAGASGLPDAARADTTSTSR